MSDTLAPLIGDEAANEFRRGTRQIRLAIALVALWLTVVIVISVMQALFAAVASTVLGILIIVPVMAVLAARGFRLQRSAASKAATRLGLPLGWPLPVSILARGPEAVTRFADNAHRTPPGASSPQIAALRHAVSPVTWRLTILGLFMIFVGVISSIVAGILAIVGLMTAVAVSPLALVALAVLCYATGYPLARTYARELRRKIH